MHDTLKKLFDSEIKKIRTPFGLFERHDNEDMDERDWYFKPTAMCIELKMFHGSDHFVCCEHLRKETVYMAVNAFEVLDHAFEFVLKEEEITGGNRV